tara:strand:+ start:189 stop:368 length:180 start_codon:yes stop_codon:yes gene_type:complete
VAPFKVYSHLHYHRLGLEHIIEDKEKHILTPDQKGVVEPQIKHHIKLLGVVSFYIEFYK